MKYVFFALATLIISCNNNDHANSMAGMTVDSASSTSDSARQLTQEVNAAMVGTSDSLMLGQTTDEAWKIAGFTDPNCFKSFFKEFKNWVARDNVDSIAAHIKFPLRNCASASDFRKNYDTLFNTAVKKSVAGQDPEKFFANYNGAMVGKGDLWFSQVNNNFYVVTINNKM
jgi:hypothetical protein